MLGLEQGVVKLVPHNPRWTYHFQCEAQEIRRSLRQPDLDIEHVGSTAIDGIDAKPILDMLIAVDDLEDIHAHRCGLSKLGYSQVTIAKDYLLFIKGPEEKRTHHLKFARRDSAYWQETLMFRDYLRSHPEIAADYENLKRRLALRYAKSRKDYTEHKGPFIHEVLRLAESEQL